MKVNGKKLMGPRIVDVYLPTADEGAVKFSFRALKAGESFDKVMPRPKPKQGKIPGGKIVFETESPAYQQSVLDWATMKFDWEFLKSIDATEGLEWTLVDMTNPGTYGKWREELETHFSEAEVNKIFQGFLDAQYITDDLMEVAKQRFLISTLEADLDSPSLQADPTNSLSGELVNV